MKPVLFLGPSLPPTRARDLWPACEVRPPVAQGDVLRALRDGATHLGIVDGYFDRVPAVMHKEILLAIENGVPVFGASSMGALRAAELHTLGMVGVGRVFEMYRDGLLEDDDEVALLHGPAEYGYRPISEPMVNLRDRLDAAVRADLISGAVSRNLVRELKSVHYRDRTAARVAGRCRELLGADCHELLAFLDTPHATVKERDAVALVERMTAVAESPGGKAPPEGLRVERTVFLERLRLQVELEALHSPSAARAPEALGANASEHALLGLLADRVAALGGPSPSEEEIDLEARTFRRAHGLLETSALRSWLRERGLSAEDFALCVRELATVRVLERHFSPELLQRTRRHLRLRS